MDDIFSFGESTSPESSVSLEEQMRDPGQRKAFNSDFSQKMEALGGGNLFEPIC